MMKKLLASMIFLGLLALAACGPKVSNKPAATPEARAQQVVQLYLDTGDTKLWDFQKHGEVALKDAWTNLNENGRIYVAKGVAELMGATGEVRPPGSLGLQKGTWDVTLNGDVATVTLAREGHGTATWKLAKQENTWAIYDTNAGGLWANLSQITRALYRSSESPKEFRMSMHELAAEAGSDTLHPLGVKISH